MTGSSNSISSFSTMDMVDVLLKHGIDIKVLSDAALNYAYLVDADRDGVITPAEYAKMAKALMNGTEADKRLAEAFKTHGKLTYADFVETALQPLHAMDSNRNGFVQLKELNIPLKEFENIVSPETAKHLATLDGDSDGKLNADELRINIRDLRSAIGSQADQVLKEVMPGINPADLQKLKNMSEEELIKADKNNDGDLSLREAFQLLKSIKDRIDPSKAPVDMQKVAGSSEKTEIMIS